MLIGSFVVNLIMLIVVTTAFIYAIKSYEKEERNRKFITAYNFYNDFNENYFIDFQYIIELDQEILETNRNENIIKGKKIIHFLSRMGLVLRAGQTDIESLNHFFYLDLFQRETIKKLLDNLSNIFSDRTLTNDEKILSIARDDFNYLINAISSTKKELNIFFNKVKEKIPAIYRAYLEGKLQFSGNLTSKVTIDKKEN